MFQKQPNMGYSTLQTDFIDDGASSPSFTPTYIQVLENDLTDWSSEGYVLVADDKARVPDDTTWAIYEYTSTTDESGNGTDDSLSGLSRAETVSRNFSSSHTFSSGTADVVVADSADLLNDIIDVLNGNQPIPGNLDMGDNPLINQSTTWPDFNNLDLSNVLNKAQLAKDGSEDLAGDLSDDQGNTIYDYASQIIPDAVLEKVWGADRDADDNSLTNLLSILDSAQSGEPASPNNGDFYMDDGTNTEDGFAGLRQFTNGDWEDVGAGDGGSNAFAFFMG